MCKYRQEIWGSYRNLEGRQGGLITVGRKLKATGHPSSDPSDAELGEALL